MAGRWKWMEDRMIFQPSEYPGFSIFSLNCIWIEKLWLLKVFKEMQRNADEYVRTCLCGEWTERMLNDKEGAREAGIGLWKLLIFSK